MKTTDGSDDPWASVADQVPGARAEPEAAPDTAPERDDAPGADQVPPAGAEPDDRSDDHSDGRSDDHSDTHAGGDGAADAAADDDADTAWDDPRDDAPGGESYAQEPRGDDRRRPREPAERLAEEARRLAEVVAGQLGEVRGKVVEPLMRRHPEAAAHLGAAGYELMAAYRALVADKERRWASRSAPAERVDLDDEQHDAPEGHTADDRTSGRRERRDADDTPPRD